MKSKFLVLALTAAIVAASGCSNSNAYDDDDDDRRTKTAMQKRYKSEAECRKEFNNPGDCKRTSSAGGGFFFMSPFFYPWGGVRHANGSMSYNNRVPKSGYTAAPANIQKSMASSTNFSRVPASYASASRSTVRGGFGGTARASSSSSSNSSGG